MFESNTQRFQIFNLNFISYRKPNFHIPLILKLELPNILTPARVTSSCVADSKAF